MKGVLQITLFIAFWTLALALTLVIFALPFLVLHLCLLFIDANGRAKRALLRLDKTLMKGEEIVAKDVQVRAFAFWKRRAVVGITSSRMIILQRGMFGGFHMSDIQWKDLDDVRLEQNVLPDLCGSNIVFKHLKPNTPLMFVDGVPERTASTIYAHAQAEEQAWEEKRRVRHMEEVRAASGGITLGQIPMAAAAAPASAPPTQSADATLADLERAKRLLDMGAISDAEFNEMKAKILARI